MARQGQATQVQYYLFAISKWTRIFARTTEASGGKEVNLEGHYNIKNPLALN